MTSLVPFATALLTFALAAQDGGRPAEAGITAKDPAAKAAWQAVVQALAGEEERAPITSFSLVARVRANTGRQSNELDDIAYKYKAPNLIRFGLDVDRETGRGPDGYWLRDKDLVIGLDVKREYKEDRDLVRRMTTIAQNVVALSDPAKLRVTSLELRDGPPASLPGAPATLAFAARKDCDWIELKSPDFDLYRDAPPPAQGEATRIFRVTIGAHRKTHLPYLVALREETEPGKPAGEPLLFELSDYRPVSGYLLPHTIKVRGFEPGAATPAFQEKPAQVIGVTSAVLNAPLKDADFAPR